MSPTQNAAAETLRKNLKAHLVAINATLVDLLDADSSEARGVRDELTAARAHVEVAYVIARTGKMPVVDANAGRTDR